MKCVEVEKQFDSLMDGETDPSIEEKIKEHLKECFLCSENFERLQEVSGVLRRSLPISPPAQLSERVMKEFARVQSSKHPASLAKNGWRTVFSLFAFPKLATSLVVTLFIISIFAAFQIGRMTATSDQNPLEVASKESTNEPIIETDKSDIPPAEVIVTKIVKVPVFKEKTVIRTIYRNNIIKKDNYITNHSNDFDANKFAADVSSRKGEYSTQINLAGFQPITKTKIRIIKKGETNEN